MTPLFQTLFIIQILKNIKALIQINYLNSKNLDFEHLEYGDHYNFTIKDIELLEQKEIILTTEKDYMRLFEVESLRDKLFYIPIEITLDKPKEFNKLIQNFVN